MTFEEYQVGTRKTWNQKPDFKLQVLNALAGLAGEVGEISEIVKKEFFHYENEKVPIWKISEELGDLLYYLTRMADLFNLDIETIAANNASKLTARYPNGFTKGGGIRNEAS